MWRRILSSAGASSSRRPALPVQTQVQQIVTFSASKNISRRCFCSGMRSTFGKVGRRGIDPDPFPEIKNLCFPLKRNVERMGVKSLTSIQKEVIPAVLSGSDVFGRGPPASGKTLAFCLPLLQRVEVEWNKENENETIAIVLCPTRELAQQISMVLHQLRGRTTTVVTATSAGDQVTSKELLLHSTLLRQGSRIVVGTAGVVSKLCEERLLDLSHLKMIVLDECDEMVSQGHEADLDAVVKYFPKGEICQWAVFAAAIDPWLKEKVYDRLRDPKVIDVIGQAGSPAAPKGVTHTWCKASRNEHKRLASLVHLIDTHLDPDLLARLPNAGNVGSKSKEFEESTGGQAIVFCATKHDCDLLAAHPALEGRAKPFHRDLLPWARTRVLKMFREGNTQVLIATDIAARGLDIPNVRLVVHYSPPYALEDYIHRSGRAGRLAHLPGTSILMLDGTSQAKVRGYELGIKSRIARIDLPKEEDMRELDFDKIEEEVRTPIGSDPTPFVQDATLQQSIHGARLLAAAFILLEKRQRGQSWVSALSGRHRYVPVLFLDALHKNIKTKQQLLQMLQQVLPDSGMAKVGRIALTVRQKIKTPY